METWTANPPPRTPITWEMSGKRSRQKTEGRREWFKQSTESQRTAFRQKHGQPMYCGIAVFVSWLCIRLSVWRLIEARNHLRNQSCSFNSTDKTNTEVPFSASTHVHLLPARAWLRCGLLICAASTAIGFHHASAASAALPPSPATWLLFIFQFHFHQPPTPAFFFPFFFFFHFSISSQWQKALEVWN